MLFLLAAVMLTRLKHHLKVTLIVVTRPQLLSLFPIGFFGGGILLSKLREQVILSFRGLFRGLGLLGLAEVIVPHLGAHFRVLGFAGRVSTVIEVYHLASATSAQTFLQAVLLILLLARLLILKQSATFERVTVDLDDAVTGHK